MSKLYKLLSLVLVTAVVVVGGTGIRVESASIGLSAKKLTLKIGESKKVSLKKVNKKLKWSISNKKVAKIKITKKYCKVTGKKAGKATLKVKYKGKTFKCKVTVKKPIVSPTDSYSTDSPVVTEKPSETPTPTSNEEEVPDKDSTIIDNNYIRIDRMDFDAICEGNTYAVYKVENKTDKVIASINIDTTGAKKVNMDAFNLISANSSSLRIITDSEMSNCEVEKVNSVSFYNEAVSILEDTKIVNKKCNKVDDYYCLRNNSKYAVVGYSAYLFYRDKKDNQIKCLVDENLPEFIHDEGVINRNTSKGLFQVTQDMELINISVDSAVTFNTEEQDSFGDVIDITLESKDDKVTVYRVTNTSDKDVLVCANEYASFMDTDEELSYFENGNISPLFTIKANSSIQLEYPATDEERKLSVDIVPSLGGTDKDVVDW